MTASSDEETLQSVMQDCRGEIQRVMEKVAAERAEGGCLSIAELCLLVKHATLASTRVRRHIEDCQACRNRLRSFLKAHPELSTSHWDITPAARVRRKRAEESADMDVTDWNKKAMREASAKSKLLYRDGCYRMEGGVNAVNGSDLLTKARGVRSVDDIASLCSSRGFKCDGVVGVSHTPGHADSVVPPQGSSQDIWESRRIAIRRSTRKK